MQYRRECGKGDLDFPETKRRRDSDATHKPKQERPGNRKHHWAAAAASGNK